MDNGEDAKDRIAYLRRQRARHEFACHVGNLLLLFGAVATYALIVFAIIAVLRATWTVLP